MKPTPSVHTQPVRIATRKSALALWQAEHAKALLEEIGAQATLVPLVTSGDKLQTGALAAENVTASQPHLATGKGLFVKEIQESLLDNSGDLAVHSMKDLPVTQTVGLAVVTLLQRADPRDVLIVSPQLKNRLGGLSQDLLSQLSREKNLKIGTVSARRRFLLKKLIGSHVQTEILRGNVDTRLRRVRAGDFDAIVLAKAGLDRLKLFSQDDMFVLDPTQFIPAAAQGVVALETRAADSALRKTLSQIKSRCDFTNVALERLVLDLLGGDCQMAVAAHVENDLLHVGWEKDEKNIVTTISISERRREIESIDANRGYSEFFDALRKSETARLVHSILKEQGFGVVPD